MGLVEESVVGIVGGYNNLFICLLSPNYIGLLLHIQSYFKLFSHDDRKFPHFVEAR